MHAVKKSITKLSSTLVPNLAVLLVLLSSALPTQAQTFKRVNVALAAPLAQVSAGGASVWALATNGKPYILKGGSFALANAISLRQIAVGGGNLRQADTVWALDSSNKIYQATKSGTTWVFTLVPGVLDFIAVGAGYQDKCHPYEVWGLNPAAQVFRYDFCAKNFVQVAGTLATLAIGGDIWGINGSGAVFRFNHASLAFDNLPGTLSQIAVGSNGFWGLFSTNVYAFYDNVQNFAPLPGMLAQIQASGNGVWGLDPSGFIYRLEPSSSLFVQIPGVLTSLSVGSGAGVWGINSAHQVFAFSTP